MGQQTMTQQSEKKRRRQDSTAATANLIRGLDHGLREMGLSLRHFQRTEGAPFSAVLQAGEVRYMVKCQEPWGDFEIPAAAPWQRSAVKDVTCGKKRFEVPSSWPENKPSVLVLSGDEASTNLSAFHLLSCGAHVRCVFLRDSAHRCWNDAKNALCECDLWSHVLETLQLMQTRHGPWKSGAWFKQLQEVSERHMSVSSAGDPLFQHLYEKLAEDYKGQTTEPLGSAAHMQEVWDLLAASKHIGAKGSRVSMTRWFEWCAQFDAFDKEYHAHQFHFVLLGLHTGLWESLGQAPVYDVPISSHRLKRKPANSSKEGSGSMQESKSQQEADEAIHCRNSIELACYLIGQPSLKRMARMILECLRPLWSAFSKEVKHAAKRKEWFETQLLFYLHQYSLPLCKVWRVLLSQEALLHMGFVFHRAGMDKYGEKMMQQSHASSSSSDSACYYTWEPRDEDAFDEYQAQKLWQLVCRLCKHRAMSMSQWRSIPPLQFIGLLSRKQENVREALKMQEANWKTLVECEKLRFSHPELQALHDSLPWLQNDVCRELLTMLAQHDFKCVPSPACSLVNAMFRGPGHTVHVENMFQHLKDFSRDASNGVKSQPKRMYHCVQSSLLAEFDLKEVSPFEAAASSSQTRLPKSTWDGTAPGCSLDDNVLKELLHSSGKAFPSPSAQSSQLHCATWTLLTHCCQENCFSSLPHAWHALLMPETQIVRKMPASETFIVLKSSPYAALLWPAQLKRSKGINVFLPDVSSGTKASWVPVLSDEGWEVVPTAALPPHVVRGCFESSLGLLGVMCVQSGSSMSLWKAAARVGFAGVIDEYLSKMLAHLGVCNEIPAKDRPRTVLAKVEALVKHCLPDLTNQELSSIILERAGLRKSSLSSLLIQGENAELTAPALEGSDAMEISKFKKAQVAVASTKASSLRWLKEKQFLAEDEYLSFMSRLGLRCPSKAGSEKAGRTVSAKGDWTWQEKALKKCIPEGSTITQVLNAHGTMWTGRYPKAGPGQQKTFSRSYGPNARSCDQAAHLVFQWLWKTHEANGGQACPHSFPEVHS